MSPGSVRALRISAVVLPLAALFLALHFLSPTLRVLHRESTLPAGYGHVGRFGRYEVFARPENGAAAGAGRILDNFSESVLREYGGALRLSPPDTGFHVLVFSTHDDLVEYAAEEMSSDFRYFGGFYRPLWRAMGVIGAGDPREIARPLFHEGTHMILDTWAGGTGHEWSRVLNEGLASYFEWSRIDRNGEVRLGGLEEERVLRLREDLESGVWVPVRDLLVAGEAEFGSVENWRYYGEAALLVHFLLEGDGGLRRDRFFAWFEREREPGPAGPSGFVETVGDPSEIDALLRRYLTLR